MTNEQKPIGYLFGKPIYLSDEIETPGPMYLMFMEEWAKKKAAEAAANQIADDMVRRSPMEAL